MSAEPSMEEILSSIKRIIAEEEAPTGRRRAARIAPAREAVADPFGAGDDGGDDEVLELSDPMPPARALAEPEPARPEPVRMAPPTVQPEPAAMPKPAPMPRPDDAPRGAEPARPAEPILSAAAADASRGALDSLSRLLVKPEPGAAAAGDGTLEGLVREMLRPMLREWLDRNLPAMVEAMVAKEIARISGQGR